MLPHLKEPICVYIRSYSVEFKMLHCSYVAFLNLTE